MLLSLAYQITERIPEYRRDLISLVEATNLSKESLIDQEYNLMDTFNTILKEPLGSIKEGPGQCIIVIDTLDECKHDGENNILDCVQRHFPNSPTWLRFFVTFMR